jgi:monoterpene epsilon-lactone hydrolase
MISPEARARIAQMFADKAEQRRQFPDGKPLELRRRDWEAEARLDVLPKGSRFSPADAGGVKSEWMDMPLIDKGRVFLLLHGGGYNAGSPRTHRKMAAFLSRAAHARVLTPDYRLAPEHVFPAAVKDALKAYGWLLENGHTEQQIVVGGDSAGGGLTLALLFALRDRGRPLPALGVPISPWTDLTLSGDSMDSMADRDPMVKRPGLQRMADWYVGGADPKDPLVSPLFGDPTGLPPLLIHVGEVETLRDDAVRFAQRATEAGVEVTLEVWPEMIHVWHVFGPDVPESEAAVARIAEFIAARLDLPAPAPTAA